MLAENKPVAPLFTVVMLLALKMLVAPAWVDALGV
jgi:hypothetical protein